MPTLKRYVAPLAESVVASLEEKTGERIVPGPAAAANRLGLTTQVPVRMIYHTEGRSRRLRLGKLEVELRNAPRWHVVLGDSPAGVAARALAWVEGEAESTVLGGLSPEQRTRLLAIRAIMPDELSTTLGRVMADA